MQDNALLRRTPVHLWYDRTEYAISFLLLSAMADGNRNKQAYRHLPDETELTANKSDP